jgi:hypothetical protein
MNPLINQMGSSMIGSIMNSMNPMQMALSMLQQRNPQMFKQVENMMLNGVNPQQAMQQLGIDPQKMQNMVSNFSRQKF